MKHKLRYKDHPEHPDFANYWLYFDEKAVASVNFMGSVSHRAASLLMRKMCTGHVSSVHNKDGYIRAIRKDDYRFWDPKKK
jgi:hypothetical protein